MLALCGLVDEQSSAGGGATYALTSTGALLQTGAPQPSMACGVLHWMEKPSWAAMGRLPDCVSGKLAAPPYDTVNKAPIFDFYKEHPESARSCAEFMTCLSAWELPAVLEGGEWGSLEGKTVCDVGGSLGTTAMALAEKFPGVKFFSMDLASVIDAAPAAQHGVEFVCGDMFHAETIPECDVVFMKHILHDWDDAAVVRILKACHAALGADGEVHICDAILPEAGELGLDDVLCEALGGAATKPLGKVCR